VGARGSGYPTGAAAAGHGAIRITNLGTVKRSDGAHLFLDSAWASRHGVEMFPAPAPARPDRGGHANAGGELGTLSRSRACKI
jgi:hypothetical protein